MSGLGNVPTPMPGPIAGAGLPGLTLASSRLVATAAEERLSTTI
jgi:hypothetical protein